jgi:hypothetical protein
MGQHRNCIHICMETTTPSTGVTPSKGLWCLVLSTHELPRSTLASHPFFSDGSLKGSLQFDTISSKSHPHPEQYSALLSFLFGWLSQRIFAAWYGSGSRSPSASLNLPSTARNVKRVKRHSATGGCVGEDQGYGSCASGHPVCSAERG